MRKIYQILPDAASRHYLRVIDESGENYRYPEAYFLPIPLPQPIEEALLQSS